MKDKDNPDITWSAGSVQPALLGHLLLTAPGATRPERRPGRPSFSLLGSSIIELEIVESVTAVAASEWDRLAGDDDPFLEHAFLAALEASGSVGEAAGCVPADRARRATAVDCSARCPST